MPSTPSDPGRARQAHTFLRGLAGRRPVVSADPRRLAEQAERRMPAEAFAYVAGGAGVERTMAANREAFDAARIVPRVLRDVSRRNLSVELFGRTLPAPLLLAPIGVLEMAHRDADLGVARAAAAEGVPMIFSSQGSVPMERCASAMGEAPRWFQLYWSTSNALVRSFLGRAEACGCDAVVLTLDATLLGWRPRDLDLAYLPFLRGRGLAQYTSDPVFLRELAEARREAQGQEGDDGPLAASVGPRLLRVAWEMARRHPGSTWQNLRTGRARAAVRRFVATYSRPSLTWDDIGWLREQTRLPILLKGILHPRDAREAVRRGVDGLIVSNHGGRQVDGAVGALNALPGVVDAADGRCPVLFDSGIRTGADVFKAIALGAAAVCIGRPYVYGLAVAGERGVRDVIRNLVADFDLTLGLAGRARIADVGPDALEAGS